MHACVHRVACIDACVCVQISLFRACDPAFMADLAQRLRMVLYTPGEIVYRPDDVGHDMFIIWQGAVLVTNEQHEATALLNAGMHFGQSALAVVHGAGAGAVQQSLRGAYATCMRPSDLLILSVRDLVQVMRDYPESGAMIQVSMHARTHGCMVGRVACTPPHRHCLRQHA